jgi:hypothetical protein
MVDNLRSVYFAFNFICQVKFLLNKCCQNMD